MKKKILALVLCFTMVFTMTGYVGFGDYTYVYAEENILDTTVEELEEVEVVKTVYDKLHEAGSLEEFRAVMMAEENREEVLGLSLGEIGSLTTFIEELYAKLEEPTEDQTYTYEELIETMTYLPAMECAECGEFGGHTEDCVRNIQMLPSNGKVGATTISSNQTWNLNGNITLTGTITVKSGCTLRIYNDSSTRTIKRASNFSGDMFFVEPGASLHINGTGGAGGGCYGNWTGAIVVDGNENVSATGQIIDCEGRISLRDTVIRNNKGYAGIWLGRAGEGPKVDVHHKTTIEITRTSIVGCTATSGAGIWINGDTGIDYTIEIWDSVIKDCTAIDASAIYFYSGGKAKISMLSCVVDNCDTTTGGAGQYGGALRTNGNGDYEFTMEDSVLRNCDSWKFGGGIYWNASGSLSKLIVEDCQFLNNTAVEMGGAMFLEGSNMVIEASAGTPTPAINTGMPDDIVGTLIQGNYAPNGGGISYKCYSNENDIRIENTVANFKENVIFKDNEGKNGAALAYNLHATDNYKQNAKFTFDINGAQFINNKSTETGGAIYVYKCRTDYQLTVNFNSGTITNNSAKNGGAIAITVENGVTTGGTFNMKSGILSDNTATANGGALFVQKGDFNMNGGTVTSNTSKNGGAAFVDGGNFNMSGGKLGDVEATGAKDLANRANYGGAVYVNGGSFTLNNSSSSIHGNVASKDGGAVYVTGDKNSIATMNNGSVKDNSASGNGGAIYVNGGGFKLTGGTINNNTAAGNGGAAYVTGGSYTMEGGTVDKNTATNYGGAVYVNGGGVTMTSGVISNNKTTAINSNGGGLYVNGGSIVIGVEKCTGTGTNHTVSGWTNKAHPQVIDNEAKDSGGGIALIGNGNITMHCGKVINNKAINPGRGLNIYMESGTFTYNAGDVGKLENPELVIVGGKLVNNSKTDKTEITLNYYHCNDKQHDHSGDLAVKTAKATKDSIFNLPDGEKYWTAPIIEGVQYRFFGWTFNGDSSTQANVRKKTDYQPLGAVINATDKDANPNDKNIHLYALWAPEVNDITYAGVTSVDGQYSAISIDISTGTPTQYTYSIGKNEKIIDAPDKNRYEFAGWYIYQDLNQNANWGEEYEPVFLEGTTTLDYSKLMFVPAGESIDFGSTNFGDITMIAKYVPTHADLKITKDGWAEDKDLNQTFVFEVEGIEGTNTAGINMAVTIHGNGSVVIKDLPVGTYLVKEQTKWSWRYLLSGINPKETTITNPELTGKDTVNVDFVNNRQNGLWLSGDSFCDNLWNGQNNSVVKRIFS